MIGWCVAAVITTGEVVARGWMVSFLELKIIVVFSCCRKNLK